MKKPRVLLHLAALAMGLCLLAGCAAQPAAPAQATIPHIETSPQPTVCLLYTLTLPTICSV